MEIIDIVLETTWTGTTSYIPLPSDQPDIRSVPTTQYLEGIDGIREVNVIKSTSRGVQINHTAAKYNFLKLHYASIGAFKR
jgi:hypothetical protein